jgi:quercetin dioxygenase-like cupin family protein
MFDPVQSAESALILGDAAGRYVTEPEPGLEREVLVHSPAMMLVRHRMRKGWSGAAHSHPHEQLVYVISGTIDIKARDLHHRASAGDSFIVPPDIMHQPTALEDSVVLDVFTPAREDYVPNREKRV